MIPLRLALPLAAALMAAQPAVHAGVLEDLMALPAIQALLGRIPELAPLVARCENPSFRQANVATCEQAEQAAKIARAPSELRAVMASKPAAASLRALCLASTGTPAGSSYLCVELGKVDSSLEAERTRIRQTEDRGENTR
jgi:hypothetical protein